MTRDVFRVVSLQDLLPRHDSVHAVNKLWNFPLKFIRFGIRRCALKVVSVEPFEDDCELPHREGVVKGEMLHRPSGFLFVTCDQFFA